MPLVDVATTAALTVSSGAAAGAAIAAISVFALTALGAVFEDDHDDDLPELLLKDIPEGLKALAPLGATTGAATGAICASLNLLRPGMLEDLTRPPGEMTGAITTIALAATALGLYGSVVAFVLIADKVRKPHEVGSGQRPKDEQGSWLGPEKDKPKG